LHPTLSYEDSRDAAMAAFARAGGGSKAYRRGSATLDGMSVRNRRMEPQVAYLREAEPRAARPE